MKARPDPTKCTTCSASVGVITRFSLVNHYSWALPEADDPRIHDDYAHGVRVVLSEGKCQRCRAVEAGEL